MSNGHLWEIMHTNYAAVPTWMCRRCMSRKDAATDDTLTHIMERNSNFEAHPKTATCDAIRATLLARWFKKGAVACGECHRGMASHVDTRCLYAPSTYRLRYCDTCCTPHDIGLVTRTYGPRCGCPNSVKEYP